MQPAIQVAKTLISCVYQERAAHHHVECWLCVLLGASHFACTDTLVTHMTVQSDMYAPRG